MSTENNAEIDKSIDLFKNGCHVEYHAGMSDTILSGDHRRTISDKFGVILLSCFTGDDLNVKFYRDMSKFVLPLPYSLTLIRMVGINRLKGEKKMPNPHNIC